LSSANKKAYIGLDTISRRSPPGAAPIEGFNKFYRRQTNERTNGQTEKKQTEGHRRRVKPEDLRA